MTEEITKGVIAFDSLDDWFAWEEANLAAANDSTQPWQWQIKAGDHLYYTAHGMPVYAEVLEAASDNPYIFVRAYSKATGREGEAGDIHRSIVERASTAEEFEAARARGWAGNEGPPAK